MFTLDSRHLPSTVGYTRSQVVSINGSYSNPRSVTSGVPQNSGLRAVLLPLYINDITDNINSTMDLFADDSIIFREIKDTQDHSISSRT